METLLSGVVFISQCVIIYLLIKKNRRLHADVGTLYASIARDLNAIVSTIAVYTGQGDRPLIIPPGQPGEGVPEPNPVDAARRKAELWRAVRAAGGRR